jgi:hypothetical protein
MLHTLLGFVFIVSAIKGYIYLVFVYLVSDQDGFIIGLAAVQSAHEL